MRAREQQRVQQILVKLNESADFVTLGKPKKLKKKKIDANFNVDVTTLAYVVRTPIS